MAFYADLPGFGIEQFPMGRSVGVVTADALPLLDRRVDKSTLHLFLKGYVAVETFFACRTGEEVEIPLRYGLGTEKEREQDCNGQQKLPWYTHGSSFPYFLTLWHSSQAPASKGAWMTS